MTLPSNVFTLYALYKTSNQKQRTEKYHKFVAQNNSFIPSGNKIAEKYFISAFISSAFNALLSPFSRLFSQELLMHNNCETKQLHLISAQNVLLCLRRSEIQLCRKQVNLLFWHRIEKETNKFTSTTFLGFFLLEQKQQRRKRAG